MRRLILALAAAPLACLAAPAWADVAASSESGFVSRNLAEVSASPETVWKALVVPGQWWNSDHTYSGDAKNLTLDPRAGGCFCEVLPVDKEDPRWIAPGSVLHMTVVNVQPGRALRLSGALGPLQSEAATGALTITLKPVGKGTRILFEYVVGGYMRYPIDQIGPMVDRVMTDQLGRLAAKVDPSFTPVRSEAAGPPAPAGTPAKPAAKPATKPVPVPAPALVPTPVPAPRDPASDAEQGAAAAAALDGLTAKKPVAPALPAPRAGYVTRTFAVTRTATGYLFTGEDPDAPLLADFATKSVADRFVKAFGAGALPANKGKAASCTCTGSFADKDGQAAFTVIDAAITFN